MCYHGMLWQGNVALMHLMLRAVCYAMLEVGLLGCLAFSIGTPCYGFAMVVILEMMVLIMLSVAIVAVAG